MWERGEEKGVQKETNIILKFNRDRSFSLYIAGHQKIITHPLDVWIKKTRDERGFGGKSLILELPHSVTHLMKATNAVHNNERKILTIFLMCISRAQCM